MIESSGTETGSQNDNFDFCLFLKEHYAKKIKKCTRFLFIQIVPYSSAAGVRALILKKNMKAKEEVNKEFKKLNKLKVSFIDRNSNQKLSTNAKLP